MSDNYPNDSDGGALKSVASHGSDMSKPIFIDFQILFASEAGAQLMSDMAYDLGYHTKVYKNEVASGWTCECSTRMVASYEAVIAIQAELAELGAECGGTCDGWGTFGNGPNSQRDLE